MEELIQELKLWKMKLIQMQVKIDELEARINAKLSKDIQQRQ